MTKYQKVDSYIKKVIADACAAENRQNDVKYKFCIIEDNVVMRVSSRYRRVIMKIEYRLTNNLPRNFGLYYNQDFDIDDCSSGCGIDVNHAIDVFSKKPLAVVRALSIRKKHLLPPYVRDDVWTEKDGCKNYYEFSLRNGGRAPSTWEKYLEDYEAIYGQPHKSVAIWE